MHGTWRSSFQGGIVMFDDKTIVRMTIVYEDGSMTILKREGDSLMSVERREKT